MNRNDEGLQKTLMREVNGFLMNENSHPKYEEQQAARNEDNRRHALQPVGQLANQLVYNVFGLLEHYS
jgi:hypothetical protein